MDKQPLVSVVIPMYNAEDYIIETLESVTQQSYSNIEIIIVDNVSTDRSFLLAEEFCKEKPEATVLQTIENSGGPAVPRNVGIQASSGKYIAFLDSDDVWDKEKLSIQIALMEEEKINFSCTSAEYIDENSCLIKKRAKAPKQKIKRYGTKSLLFRNTVTTSSVIVSAELLRNKCFEEDPRFITVEDYHLWMNLVADEYCTFAHITQPLLRYRCMPQSLGQKDGRMRFLSRSLLACAAHIVESRQYSLMLITLCSHLIRAILLLMKSLK